MRPATAHSGRNCPANGRRKLSWTASPRIPPPKKQAPANSHAIDCSKARDLTRALTAFIAVLLKKHPDRARTTSADRKDGHLHSQTARRTVVLQAFRPRRSPGPAASDVPFEQGPVKL